MQTSMGKLITVNDVICVKNRNDLQDLIDSLHRQLIRRFLYWDDVNVDAMNPFQLFVLLDVFPESLYVSGEVIRFIDSILNSAHLSGRKLQISKLGLYFLTSNLPTESLHILQNEKLKALTLQGLATIPSRPSAWLSRTKTVFMVLQRLSCVEEMTQQKLKIIWESPTLLRIIRRILFDNLTRFTLYAPIASIHNYLKSGQVSTIQVNSLLSDLLVDPKETYEYQSTHNITR